MPAVKINYDEWMKFAERKLNPIVVNFIRKNPEKLLNREEGLFPSKWEKVSKFLNNYNITRAKQISNLPFTLKNISITLNGDESFINFIKNN